MKVFVCIKQVPDTETKIKIGSGNQIDTVGIKWIMNPYDEYAVEEAIRFKEKTPGTQVFALTIGPKARAAEVLRTALAMGVDEGILIDAPAETDLTTTARALAEAIRQEGDAKIIFSGKLAIDDNASSVSQMLAEFLNVPHATVVSKFTLEGNKVLVERDIEGGAKEVIQMETPCVVGANKGLNMPRYASLPGIMKAKKKTLKELSLATLNVSSTTKSKVLSLELPAEKPAVKMMQGDLSAQAQQLVTLLRDEAKVL